MSGLKRLETPCPRCNWRYEGYHVCFDASKPCPGEGVIDPNAPRKRRVMGERSAEHRQSISESQTERWQIHHEEMRPRDEKIVAEYKAGEGLRALGEKYDVAYQTVMRIIRREEIRTGESIMRTRTEALNARKKLNAKKKEVHGGFQ